MKKKILSIGVSGILLLAVLSVTSNSTLGVNAMEKINANYPDNIITFGGPDEQSEDDVLPKPRVFPQPSEESLKLTQEQVQAFDCGLVEDVSVPECEALVALYASTNGSAWANNTNWLQSTTVGDWYGVGITFYEGPSNLTLSGNNLVGTIPPEIGNLPELRVINLSENYLRGGIPSELFQLEYLGVIALNDNLLSGTLPSELGSEKYFTILLNGNQFTGQIPDTFDQAERLRLLDLSRNQLSGEIPATLGQAYNLWDLYLSDNQLSGTIPSTLGNLKQLSDLDLSSNQLSGTIPEDLGSIRYLYYLNLANNKLEGAVPEYITNLDLYSRDVDFGYNRLNVPQEEPVQSFLNEKDPDWYLTQAVQVTTSCDSDSEIISRNGRVMVSVPNGACDGEIDILLAPIKKPSHAFGAMFWARNSFELNAWNEHGEVTQFQKPLTFTLYYSDGGIGPLPEDQLVVEMFDEDYMVWHNAVNTCPNGVYTRNFDENWVRLPVCHLTEFGLFNMPEMPYRLYIPISLK